MSEHQIDPLTQIPLDADTTEVPWPLLQELFNGGGVEAFAFKLGVYQGERANARPRRSFPVTQRHYRFCTNQEGLDYKAHKLPPGDLRRLAVLHRGEATDMLMDITEEYR